MNMVNISNSTPRRKRSRGDRQYISPLTIWCMHKWPPSGRSETTRKASYSNRTVFITTFKPKLCIYNLSKSYSSLFYSVHTDCYYTAYWPIQTYQTYDHIGNDKKVKLTPSPTCIFLQRFRGHISWQYSTSSIC
jgi:hypothetical protein